MSINCCLFPVHDQVVFLHSAMRAVDLPFACELIYEMLSSYLLMSFKTSVTLPGTSLNMNSIRTMLFSFLSVGR
ncbi:MAG: hypothetical protein K5881_00095 [Saccharofermentans sp.]|nr:hypothetical protein [Saccharofermentans sp.]